MNRFINCQDRLDNKNGNFVVLKQINKISLTKIFQ